MPTPAQPVATGTHPMLYCILRRQQQPLQLPPGLREVHTDGLSAVLGEVSHEQVRRAERAMLQDYAETIAGLHRMVDLIPMRFGSLAVSDEAVKRLLVTRSERLTALLDRLNGCVELGLRLVLPTPTTVAPAPADEPQDPRPGHAHLAVVRRRVRGEAQLKATAETVRTAIEAALVGLFRDAREELAQVGDHHLLSLYYLVQRDRVESFVAALRHAPDPLPAPAQEQCLVSGPWPPYNFVGAIDDDLRCLA